MEFKKAELESIDELTEGLSGYRGRICDISAGNLVFWSDYYDVSYYLGEGGLALRFGDMDDVVSYYCGTNDALIRAIIEREGGSARFSCITAEEAEYFSAHYDCDEPLHSRDWDDYIYDAQDIVGLRGKRYNGQRNHINKFNRLYPDADFCEINEQNAGAVKEFVGRYFRDFAYSKAKVAEYEEEKLYEQLDNLERYRACTGVLTVGGKVVGFSIGEVVGETLIIHTEKADVAYEGVYPALVKLFAARYATDGVRYINREEDCGESGLRTSKLSYHPIEILGKYTLCAALKK